MPVQVKFKDGAMIAFLKGEIDHHSAPDMREAIDDAIIGNDTAKHVILDFSSVSFMDSSGVGLVMGRYRLASQKGKTIELVGLSSRNYKIMRMSGVEKLMSVKNNDAKKDR